VLIPIRDDNPTARRAYVTLAIIALNVALFVLWQRPWSPPIEQQLFDFCHAEIPWEVTHGTNLANGGAEARVAIEEQLDVSGRAFQLLLQGKTELVDVPPELEGFGGCPDKNVWASVFVAMFLHGGWLHLGGNMLFLWVFGNNVEDTIGRVRYLLFYLFCGVAAAAGQWLVDPSSVIPNLGASGAIAGVLGAYLVMFPRRRVYSLVPILFIFTLMPLPAIVVLGFWFILQFFSGITTVASDVNGGVAYFAHVGGFVAGLLLALLFFPKERVRRDPDQGLFP
jgi:membrane associated rhomboid family serine protease